MTDNSMDISIVIPAYDESSKIEKDLLLAGEFFRKNNLSGEIIVVDDGSRDSTSDRVRAAAQSMNLPVTLIRNESNSGKGNAVRKGIMRSNGNYIVYQDAGATVPLDYALTAIDLIKKGNADIAIGSRKLPGSIITKEQETDRKIISRSFKRIIDILFGGLAHFSDTQCGFKIYRREAAKEIFSKSKIDGFIFEIETLLIAQKKNYKIVEFPVEWGCDRDSRISLLKSPWKIILDLIKIKMGGY